MAPLKDIEPLYRQLGESTYNMSHQEVTNLVKSSDLETQYALYIFYNQRIRPHRSDLATILAKRGESIVPFLCNKMEEAKEGVTIANIVLIFKEMEDGNIYKVSEKLNLMQLIKSNIIRFPGYQGSAELESFNEMQFSSDTFVKSYKFSDPRCNNWVTTFFRNKRQTEQEYKSFDLETQFLLITCGKQAWQPTTQWLRITFAKNGENAVPFLRNILQNSQDEIAITQAIALFDQMTCEKSYDLAKDKELCNLLLETIKKLPKTEWRDRREEWVKKMLRDGS